MTPVLNWCKYMVNIALWRSLALCDADAINIGVEDCGPVSMSPHLHEGRHARWSDPIAAPLGWGGEPDSEHDRHATPTFFFSQFPRMIGWTVSKHRICPPPLLPQHYSIDRRGIRDWEMKERMKGRRLEKEKYWRKTRNAKEGIKRKKNQEEG